MFSRVLMSALSCCEELFAELPEEVLLLPVELPASFFEHEAADVIATHATAARAMAFFLKSVIVLRPFI